MIVYIETEKARDSTEISQGGWIQNQHAKTNKQTKKTNTLIRFFKILANYPSYGCAILV